MKEVEAKVQFTNADDVEEFVKAAGKCDFDIDILYQHVYIDAKSFLGILGLGLSSEDRKSPFHTQINNILSHFRVSFGYHSVIPLKTFLFGFLYFFFYFFFLFDPFCL